MGEGSGRRSQPPRYFRTRAAAAAYVEERLVTFARRGQRALVGWDFSFGYPKGLTELLRLPGGRPWLRMWKLLSERIRDEPDNRNNRFAVAADLNRLITGGNGPFWGTVGKDRGGVLLRPTKDFSYPIHAKLAERRLVEERAWRMQPAWKLAYTGSVGSQALLGIPYVHRLAHHAELLSTSSIWPFQTNFAGELPASGPLIVHAEIYPSHLPLPKVDDIPDREQVKYYVRWLQQEQRSGRLPGWLAGPAELTEEQRRRAIEYEGWVLGIK